MARSIGRLKLGDVPLIAGELTDRDVTHLPSDVIDAVDIIELRVEKPQFHPGIDIAGCEGTPILAPAAGKVAFADKNGLLGLTIKLAHDSTYETEFTVTWTNRP